MKFIKAGLILITVATAFQAVPAMAYEEVQFRAHRHHGTLNVSVADDGYARVYVWHHHRHWIPGHYVWRHGHRHWIPGHYSRRRY